MAEAINQITTKDSSTRTLYLILVLGAIGYFLIVVLLSLWVTHSNRFSLLAHANSEGLRIVEQIQSKINTLDQKAIDFSKTLSALIKLSTYGYSVKRIRLIAPDNSLLASTDLQDRSKWYDDELEIQSALKGKSTLRLDSKRKNGSDYIEYYAPLFAQDGSVIAAAEVYSDVSYALSQAEKLKSKVISVMTISVLLFTLIFAIFARRLILRMQRAKSVLAEKELKLRQLNSLAHSASMLAGLAHQLKNPISILCGVASSLSRRDSSEEQKPFINALSQETKRISNLVDTFLSFAKPLNVTAVPIDLSSTLTKAFKQFHTENPTTHIHSDIAANVRILADETLIFELFLNLLQNAYQAVAFSKIDQCVITIKLHCNIDQVYVTIDDNGPGFPEEMLKNPEQAFEPFFTTKPGGSGLGLSTAQKIALQFGGQINISNIPNSGARVVVHFNLANSKKSNNQ